MTLAGDRAAAPQPTHWPSVVALNAVSTLAQIGQYGMGFALLPLALSARGVGASEIGAISAAVWAGMLVGLIVAPAVIARLSHRSTVLCGLGASAVALLWLPALAWPWWGLPAAVLGFGTGLRWIGNETWLYRCTPSAARGRIVGFHEALIGMAGVVGPGLIAIVGVAGTPAFVLACGCTLAAALPLWAARTVAPAAPAPSPATGAPARGARLPGAYLGLGVLVAGAGGMMEAGWLALFPVYLSGLGRNTAQIAWLLAAFGLGGMLLQFPIGWLADRHGVRATSAACALLVGLCVAGLAAVEPATPAFIALLFVLGGAMAGFLTLGLVAATRHANPATLSSQVTRVSIMFTACSAAGPLLAGEAVAVFGPQALLAFVMALAAAVALLLARAALLRQGDPEP